MNDVFLSYAREDTHLARTTAHLMKRMNWSVWWDQKSLQPVDEFRKVIDNELEHSRIVLVLWSEHSVTSHFVLSEAERGRRRNCLVQVLLSDVRVPLGFDVVQYLDLRGWDGTYTSPQAIRLLEAVSSAIERPIVDRKRLEELRVVEDHEFTKLWMTALETNRLAGRFSGHLHTVLEGMSGEGGTWSTETIISYLWFLEELGFSGQFDRDTWSMLKSIVESPDISEEIRRDTLKVLPEIHSRLSRFEDIEPPALFTDNALIQPIFRSIIELFESPFSTSGAFQGNALHRVITWLWDVSDEEAHTHIYLMVVDYLRQAGKFSPEINTLMLNEKAFETSNAFGQLLVDIHASLGGKGDESIGSTDVALSELADLTARNEWQLQDMFLQASQALDNGDEDSYEKVVRLFTRESIEQMRRSIGGSFTLKLLEWLIQHQKIDVMISLLALGYVQDVFGTEALRLLDDAAASGVFEAKQIGPHRISVLVALISAASEEDYLWGCRLLVALHATATPAHRDRIVATARALSAQSKRVKHLYRYLAGKITLHRLEEVLSRP